MQVLLQPAQWSGHDDLVKLKDFTLAGFGPDHAISPRGLAVDLDNLGLISDISAVDGRLCDLFQDFVVCPRAKEVFYCCVSVGQSTSVQRALTTLNTLLQPKELQTLSIERTPHKVPP